MDLDTLDVRIPYRPRWFQQEVHAQLKRFNVLVFHRRAGKTVLAVNELIKQITRCKLKNPRGHYIAPYYGQVKRIAWQYVIEFTEDIPGMLYNKGELRAIFPNGAEIQLLGGDNYQSHRGIYSDYAVLDEYAQMHPGLWGEVFRPALSDRKGGAMFIGTPMGHNAFHDKWEQAGTLDGWFRAMYKVNETGALDAEEIIAASREMSREEFEQEYLCSWTAAIKGAYYGKQMEQLEADGRITSVPWDPALQVITSWDLGIRDSTAVHYWQIAGAEHRLIDCDAFVGVGLPEIIETVRKKKYQYSQHIAPHDIKVRELGSGTSRLDIAAQLGVIFDIAPSLGIQDGIQAVRAMLPKTVIDREKCATSLEALRQYRTEYDDRRQVFRNNPLHDWSSDYADSIRYYAITPKSQIRFSLEPFDHREADRNVI